MQLDQTHITIRERVFAEVLDLALQVFRAHWWPVLVALAVGALPFALLNYYMIGDMVSENAIWDDSTGYIFTMLWLVVWQTPIATAPLTLFLGQVTFNHQVHAGRVLRDFLASLPQLIVLQAVLRGILTLFFVTLLLPYASWPYLNEILLLERNPLFAGKQSRLTTLQRSRNLHRSSSGDLLGRWFYSAMASALLIAAATFAITLLVGQLRGRSLSIQAVLWVVFPLATWMVAGYFTVARFLSYLDMRIRREGWEVELSLRAEADRLAQQVAA